VAETVELRADAVPAHDDIVVVRELLVTERGAGDLPGLQDGHRVIARSEGGCAAIGLDAELVRLAGLDQLRRSQRFLRSDVVQVADLVVRAMRRMPTLVRHRRHSRHQHRQQRNLGKADQGSHVHRCVSLCF